MQFKNIILSAALLAMVSAAPINQAADSAPPFKALSAADSAPPAAPETPAHHGLDFEKCKTSFEQPSAEKPGFKGVFFEACKSCLMSYKEKSVNPDFDANKMTEEEATEVTEFFKEECEAPSGKKTVKARDEPVSGLPTTIGAPEDRPKVDSGAATAPKVAVPETKNPEVSDVQPGNVPTVNTAGKSA